MKFSHLSLVFAAASLTWSEARTLLRATEKIRVGQNVTQPQGAAEPWNGQSGLKCVGWRTTLGCSPSGPRDQLADKGCLTIINSSESGFCECEGYVHTAAVPCGHRPVNCTHECGILQKLHREVFGGFPGEGGQNEAEEASAMDKAKKVVDSKDPYAAAQMYGQKAVRNVNQAVANSNTMLSSARDMIGKMMNLKPWAQISQMGKDAEEAGKKTQELAKLARPFIYAQVPASHDLSQLQIIKTRGIKDPCAEITCAANLKCPGGFSVTSVEGHCCPYCVNPNIKLEAVITGATGSNGGKASTFCPKVWCFPTSCTKAISNPTTTNGACCPTCPAL